LAELAKLMAQLFRQLKEGSQVSKTRAAARYLYLYQGKRQSTQKASNGDEVFSRRNNEFDVHTVQYSMHTCTLEFSLEIALLAFFVSLFAAWRLNPHPPNTLEKPAWRNA
jgi:hypothetical protein